MLKPTVSIVIPARNEADRILLTLQSLRNGASGCPGVAKLEVIVVDDASEDGTASVAGPWSDRVIKGERHAGKGKSLERGLSEAGGDIAVFLDADLGESAVHAGLLIDPVVAGLADMAIARLPAAGTSGGFGLVKGLARHGIRRLSGYAPQAPLSGQRAFRAEVLRHLLPFSAGYGVEVGLTIEAARRGYIIKEVPVPFAHRETGRNWQGFRHRGRQFVEVGATLLDKWRQGARP
jgi:glycosyltransferase involved in cell wall biosynthesis